MELYANDLGMLAIIGLAFMTFCLGITVGKMLKER